MTTARFCAALVFVMTAASPPSAQAALRPFDSAHGRPEYVEGRQAQGGQSAADVEQGRTLFQGMCVTCHGFEGAGGEAPSLNRAKLDRAPDDDALRAVIGIGIPDRGMPRVRRLSDNELGQLVTYVRSLGRTAPARVEGNAQRGKELYQQQGCASCHIVEGQGGSFGPVLTNIGVLRGLPYLREALVDPASVLPRSTLGMLIGGQAEYLPVRIVTSEGREVRGVRVNEDSFTIQVRDSGNRFHSFRKADVKQLDKLTGQSLMPSVKGRLADSELTDLLAYLSSLRGAL